MPNAVHRNNDSRNCGARTKASSRRVFVNNRPVSIDRDINSHGAGQIRARTSNVFVNNKKISVVNDNASPDNHRDGAGNRDHPNPRTSSGSPNVYAGK